MYLLQKRRENVGNREWRPDFLRVFFTRDAFFCGSFTEKTNLFMNTFVDFLSCHVALAKERYSCGAISHKTNLFMNTFVDSLNVTRLFCKREVFVWSAYIQKTDLFINTEWFIDKCIHRLVMLPCLLCKRKRILYVGSLPCHVSIAKERYRVMHFYTKKKDLFINTCLDSLRHVSCVNVTCF